MSFLLLLLFLSRQPNHQHRNVRRAYPGDPSRLAQVLRLHLVQLLHGLQTQAKHLAIVQTGRELLSFQPPGLLNVRLLAADVALIFQLNLHAFQHIPRQGRAV